MKEKQYYRFPNGSKKKCTYDRAIGILRKLQRAGCPNGDFVEISKGEYERKEEK
ncbi:unnamed protein product [marine sediment metagenome]|uniref:Uncharacterized protein n=1 Tax=marine sediment metagenome TaxID=412755 RepID=X1HYK0_9ZZZZ